MQYHSTPRPGAPGRNQAASSLRTRFAALSFAFVLSFFSTSIHLAAQVEDESLQPPFVQYVDPGILPINEGPVLITVHGAYFLEGIDGDTEPAQSAILFNGQPLSTVFVSSTRLTAVVPLSLLTAPGCAQITVANDFGLGTPSNAFVVGMGKDCIDSAQFQVNSPEAHLTLNQVQAGGPFGPAAITRVAPGQSVSLAAKSNLSFALWDVVASPSELVSLGVGGFRTRHGQIVNIDTAVPGMIFLSTGRSSYQLMDWRGDRSYQFVAPQHGASYSLQMLILDPAHPDGVRLSQGAQLDVVTDSYNFGARPLQLGDDSYLQIPLGFDAIFADVAYSDIFVSSNGSVTLGGGDRSYIADIGGFVGGPTRLAPLWTDMDPSQGGKVTVYTDPDTMTWSVIYEEVPLYGSKQTNSVAVHVAPGSITFAYESVVSQDAIVGLSAGVGNGLLEGLDMLHVSGMILPEHANPFQLFEGDAESLTGFTIHFQLNDFGWPELVTVDPLP